MFQVEAPRERIVAHNWETTMISHNDSLISHSALAAKSCNDTCSENPPYKSVDTLECRVRPGLLTSDWDSAKESLVVHSTKFVFARICRLRMKRNAQVWLCWLFEPKEDLVVVRCRIHSDVEKHCDPLTSWVLPQECPSLIKCLGGVCSKEGVDFDSPPRNDSLSGSDNGISNSVFSARSETQPIGAAEEGLGRRTAVFIDTTFFQWYPGVKLSALLKNQNNNIPLSMYPHCAGVRPFTEDVSVHILRAIGDAIHGLHERGIPHGGIEPNAIFVTPSLRIFVKKQCDAPHQLPLPDSLRWRPPEFSLLLDDDVPLSVEEQMKGDVWSFGCLALLLVSGQRPFASEDDVRGIASRLSSLLEVGSSNPLGGVDETTAVRMLGIDLDVPVCSANLMKLIQRCLHPNPRLRPSMTELLTSSAFRRASLSSASIPSVISCLTEGSNPLTAGPNTTRKGKETNSNSFTAEDVRVLCMNAWLVETVRMFKKNFLCEGQSQRDWPAGGEVGLSSMSSKDMRRRNCQSFVADLSSNLRSEIFGCSEQVISYVDRCFSANQDETLVSATMETIRNLVGFTRDAGSRSSHVHGKHLSSSSEDMSSRGKAWLNNFWQAFPFTSTKRLVKSDSKRHLSTILTSEISQVPDDDYTLTMTQSVAMNADVSEDDEHVCETCLQTDGRAHGLTRVRGTAFSRVEEEAGVTHFSKSVSDQIVGLSLKKILIVMSVVGFSVVVVVMCAIVIVKHA